LIMICTTAMLDVQRRSLGIAEGPELILEDGHCVVCKPVAWVFGCIGIQSHLAAEKRVTSNFAQCTVYTVCGIRCTFHIDI